MRAWLTILLRQAAPLRETKVLMNGEQAIWRDDFSGLPPVHIVTAEFDPLRDEGEALYQRLTEQGVDCTCQRWSGVIHGFFQLGGISPAARGLMRDLAWRAAGGS